MVAEHRRWLQAFAQHDHQSQVGRIENWLMRLLTGLAGNLSQDDVRMRMTSFVFALEEKPAFCFGDASLRLAIRRFKKFWPTTGELLEFIEEYEASTREKAQRAFKVVDTGPRGAGPRPGPQDRDFKWSKAEAEAQGRRNYEAQAKERREILQKLGIEPIPVPPRASDESERDYCIRLAQHAKAICAGAGRLKPMPKGLDDDRPPCTDLKTAYEKLAEVRPIQRNSAQPCATPVNPTAETADAPADENH